MIEQTEFEIYLYIENEKFKIFLFDALTLKNIYTNELIINKNSFIDFEVLIQFLDDNIFKIEKLSKRFIEDIFLIIDTNTELHTDISIKKKNNNDNINFKNLNKILIELKDLFKENNKQQEIMHMLVENFIIDGKNYKFFVENLKSDYLNLDVKFITLPEKFINKLNKIFERYQIKVKHFMSAKYLKKFINSENIDISLMAHKILNGYNVNEIAIVPKTKENKGFFERFFQLFS